MMVYVPAGVALFSVSSRPPIWQLLVSRPEKWLFRGPRGNGKGEQREWELILEGGEDAKRPARCVTAQAPSLTSQ